MAFESKNNKVIFIHLMKTGGTFVRTLYPDFQEISPVHASAKATKDLVSDEKWKESFKFGFVRHPYDTMVSLYRYLKDHSEHADHKMSELNFHQFLLNFEKFKLNKGFYSTHTKMLYHNDMCLVDKIFKQEEMEDAVAYLHQNHGALNSTNKINVSTKTQAPLTEKNKEIIYRMFKEDFETFGYLP